jgi:ketosteroid isomerase-like protein|tara:strand:+ start:837 stop:1766 length:930 start_codon:yes stop_codon:yes gene_type:complete
MKNILYLLSFLFVFSLNAQKNKNGVVFDKHPGIDLVNSFNEAFVAADMDKLNTILHDDFKAYDGLSSNKDQEGTSKQNFMGQSNWWNTNISYLKISNNDPAYPDAVEYKKGDQLWVQTWEKIYGVNNQTGVKFDMPIHRLYRLTKDGKKIISLVDYTDRRNYQRMWDAWPGNDLKNGTIYKNHENINSVRILQYAYANGDVEKAMSYFHENASFNDINESSVMNQEQILERDGKIFAGWNLDSLDEVGYPDYLEYDWRESKVVMSWWNFRMTRKSDGKEVTLPVHFSDRFDNDGKIVWRTSYWNKSLLD